MTKLFVGNLSFDTTEDSLRTLFAAHGTVETIALISDRDTGRPRGFGFIEMSNADASRAMQALDARTSRTHSEGQRGPAEDRRRRRCPFERRRRRAPVLRLP